MEKLTYLVNWGNDKENAWSGTYYSLYKALSKYYDVKDIDTKSEWIIETMQRKLLRMDNLKIVQQRNQRWGRKLKKTEGKVFQFGKILPDSDKRQTYMYVDLTFNYVEYMQSHLSEVFAVSSYQNSTSKVFHERALEQDEYMRTCSGVFTMGQWLKEWLIGRGFPADRIHAVGGGTNVDTSLISPQPKTHNKILFVGKDFKRKGGYITYDAFKLLREQGENVELYVIGPQVSPIDNPIEGYHFIGQIPYNEEAKYYNMCDIFCMPSYFEAYGLVFVEALTFGLPCIGRNCYEMPYFIQDGKTGLLLNDDDPHELAGLMLRLLRDDSFSHNVLSNRNQYIHDYSWETVAGRIAKVIG